MKAEDVSNEGRQQTNFIRATNEMKKAVELISEKTSKPNILLVGPGTIYVFRRSSYEFIDGPTAENMNSTYQPFVLASILEGAFLDYNMTILDLSPAGLDLVKKQKEIKIRKMDFQFGFITRAFDKYIENCKLNESEYWFEHDNNLKEDVVLAKIPKSFSKKRENNEINFIKGDIAEADLSKYSPFDLVVCTNVLKYQPTEKEKIKSLKNIEKNMSDNSYLIIDNITELIEADGSKAHEYGFVDLTKRLESPGKRFMHYILKKNS